MTLKQFFREMGEMTAQIDTFGISEVEEKELERNLAGFYDALYKEMCVVRRLATELKLAPRDIDVSNPEIDRLYKRLMKYLKSLTEEPVHVSAA